MSLDAFFLLSPAEEVTNQAIIDMARMLGYTAHERPEAPERGSTCVTVTRPAEKRGDGAFWTMSIDSLEEAVEDEMLSQDEMEEIAGKGFQKCIQIDCHLDTIPLLRSLLHEMLEKWGGFLMYDDFHDRYGIEQLDQFKPVSDSVVARPKTWWKFWSTREQGK